MDLRHQGGADGLEDPGDEDEHAREVACKAAAEGEDGAEQGADGEEERDEDEGKHETGHVVVVGGARGSPSAARMRAMGSAEAHPMKSGGTLIVMLKLFGGSRGKAGVAPGQSLVPLTAEHTLHSVQRETAGAPGIFDVSASRK
jgi:hypothetical protein